MRGNDILGGKSRRPDKSRRHSGLAYSVHDLTAVVRRIEAAPHGYTLVTVVIGIS